MPTAPGPHDAGIEYGVLAADIAADNMAAHIAAADEHAVMTDSTAKGFTLVYRERSFMPTAPGPHDAGIAQAFPADRATPSDSTGSTQATR